jgi:hypothetical protein
MSIVAGKNESFDAAFHDLHTDVSSTALCSWSCAKLLVDPSDIVFLV